MALDFQDSSPEVPPLDRGFSPPAFQWPRRLPKTPPAVAKALAVFAPAPRPPEFPRAPPNSAIRPTSVKLPAQIFRSTAPGTRPASSVLRPATARRKSASLFPAAPEVLPVKLSPSALRSCGCRASARQALLIILSHRRDQSRSKVLRHPVQRRVLLFKEALHVRRNLVFAPEQKIICLIHHLLRGRFRKRNGALHRHQHRRSAPRDRIKEQRNRLHAYHCSAQYRIALRGV